MSSLPLSFVRWNQKRLKSKSYLDLIKSKILTEHLTQCQKYYAISSSLWLLGMWTTQPKSQEFFTFLFTVVLILAWDSFPHRQALISTYLRTVKPSTEFQYSLSLQFPPLSGYSVLNILAMLVSWIWTVPHNLGGNILFWFLLGFGNSFQTVNWGNHKVYFICFLSGGHCPFLPLFNILKMWFHEF